jgi:hypothetical protein
MKLFYFCQPLKFFRKFRKIAHNVKGLRRFGRPNREMRSISRADKMWVEGGVGMKRSGMT